MSEYDRPAAPGAVALVGSGEYTPAMRETDAYLLGTLGGAARARVALLPTASGREEGSPARWNAMGAEHFAALGVREVRPVPLIDRAGASDPDVLGRLEGATFYYFSGGDPGYLIETLRGTPAWALIAEAYAHGAVLAGCSAGAMALGGRTHSIQRVRSGPAPDWLPALGIVPQAVCFPHFDRMARYIGEERLQALLAAVPSGYTGLGIDEDTALVRVGPPATSRDPAAWRVMGRQHVTLFVPGAPPRVLAAGEQVQL